MPVVTVYNTTWKFFQEISGKKVPGNEIRDALYQFQLQYERSQVKPSPPPAHQPPPVPEENHPSGPWITSLDQLTTEQVQLLKQCTDRTGCNPAPDEDDPRYNRHLLKFLILRGSFENACAALWKNRWRDRIHSYVMSYVQDEERDNGPVVMIG